MVLVALLALHFGGLIYCCVKDPCHLAHKPGKVETQ